MSAALNFAILKEDLITMVTIDKLLSAAQMLTIFIECGELKAAISSYFIGLPYGNLVLDPAAFAIP